MPRAPRIDVGGFVYHITARGDNREKVFVDPNDYAFYLDSIHKAKKRFPFYFYAYTFLPNHIHLLIETVENNTVAKFMHLVQTRYTTYFNYKYKRCGHVFQGRYHNLVVEEESHLLQLLGYIHLNPVRAGLVEECGDYPYSSYRSYISPDSNNIIDTAFILEQFASRKSTQVKRFKAFVDQQSYKKKPYTPDRYVKDKNFLGSEEFREMVLERHFRGHRRA